MTCPPPISSQPEGSTPRRRPVLPSDLRALTMFQACVVARISETAAFRLFVRRLHETGVDRFACRRGDLPAFFEALRFDQAAGRDRESLGRFCDPFLRRGPRMSDASPTGGRRNGLFAERTIDSRSLRCVMLPT